jgi:glycosyltransferase involved in cell wall biosynthesis
MRIAILSPHSGHIVGGVETAAKNLSKHLSKKHECRVFSLTKTSWTEKVPGIIGPHSPTLVSRFKLNYLNRFIPFIYLFRNHAFAEISFCLNLTSPLRSYDPDIIINLNFSILTLFCKYYRYRYKVPFIHAAQGGFTYGEIKSARLKPDAFIALTPLARDIVKAQAKNTNIAVIPNGVDIHLFSTKESKPPISDFIPSNADPDLQLEPPLILSTSRLVREKRLDLLVKAVSQMDCGTLILIGKGAEKKNLVQLGQTILKNRIIFLDTVSQEKLAKLYRACDVFSLPSRNEAFGNVLVEAMASGLPVVATNDKGFRWILGRRGGICVDVTDAQSYAQALKIAYDRDFGDGPVIEAQRFSWERVSSSYLELIIKVLKQRIAR